ncbi:Cmx/CmrA family chloramphenicol efflux MFS transporter [Nocardia terpenica]|uniref:Cmx/CmrA family chloramphenicol efflux MFS transporter n=1 Tax=Nocardia terpenica TaxID=455432 RepID=A0A6G9ZED2_9NOCA|nr:Cmx/CmrA family chloramphenicol efflux MFS transporter [Nocardia terpenica]QIS23804.1 Cmx/CmrA family chloramphenicol efflux MFS transporter [Nocardia terpenica]
MPLAVYILGLSIFAQGTSELMLTGLLPSMSGDLGVSVPQAGLLISAFAIGMMVGAPVLSVVTQRWSRRTALLAFMAVFIAVHVLAAVTSDYRVLFATRVVGAFVYAGFWAVGSSTAIGLVPVRARGRAMSIVAGGLTVASIVGVPAGTFIGQHLGWRGAFWTVALLSALAMIGVLAKVPNERPAEVPQLRNELRALTTGPVGRLMATNVLATTALLVSFSYLGALLSEATGLAEGWVPVVLGLYGVGSLVGIVVGGRTADVHPQRTLLVGVTGLIVISVLLALTARHIAPVAVLVFLLGAFGFGVNPVLNSRVFTLAPQASTLGAAGNTVAFNIGITAGPWLGGLAIGAGMGYPSVAWIGAVLGVGALLMIGWSQRLDRGTGHAPADVPAELVPAEVN